jgi:hypothetical protein
MSYWQHAGNGRPAASAAMPFEILPLVLAGVFCFVLAYVVWLKFHEHLHAHRREHASHPHHLVSVRKLRKKKRNRPRQPVGWHYLPPD